MTMKSTTARDDFSRTRKLRSRAVTKLRVPIGSAARRARELTRHDCSHGSQRGTPRTSEEGARATERSIDDVSYRTKWENGVWSGSGPFPPPPPPAQALSLPILPTLPIRSPPTLPVVRSLPSPAPSSSVSLSCPSHPRRPAPLPLPVRSARLSSLSLVVPVSSFSLYFSPTTSDCTSSLVLPSPSPPSL